MVIVLLKYTHSRVFLDAGIDVSPSKTIHLQNFLPVFDYPDETRKVQGPQEAREVVEKVNTNSHKEGSVRDDSLWHDRHWGKEPLPNDEHGNKHNTNDDHCNDTRCRSSLLSRMQTSEQRRTYGLPNRREQS